MIYGLSIVPFPLARVSFFKVITGLIMYVSSLLTLTILPLFIPYKLLFFI